MAVAGIFTKCFRNETRRRCLALEEEAQRLSRVLWVRAVWGSPFSAPPDSKWKNICRSGPGCAEKAAARPLVASPGATREASPARDFASINQKERGQMECMLKCHFWVTMATGELVKPKVQLSCPLFHINLGRRATSFPPFPTPVSWCVYFEGFKKRLQLEVPAGFCGSTATRETSSQAALDVLNCRGEISLPPRCSLPTNTYGAIGFRGKVPEPGHPASVLPGHLFTLGTSHEALHLSA